MLRHWGQTRRSYPPGRRRQLSSLRSSQTSVANPAELLFWRETVAFNLQLHKFLLEKNGEKESPVALAQGRQ
jgi:hypothetical protein